jgi:hypothetical protein
MLYRKTYRAELTKDESELLRTLRGRGFAVAIFGPSAVGTPLNRKPIEEAMVNAGLKALKEDSHAHNG